MTFHKENCWLTDDILYYNDKSACKLYELLYPLEHSAKLLTCVKQ